MRHASWINAGLLLATLAPSTPAPARGRPRLAPPTSFVGVRSTSFVLDGKPFTFVGANVGVMHGPAERNGYRKTLRAARDDGLSVVRIWAMGEGPANAPAWYRQWQLFRAGPTGWIPATVRHLDKVLAETRRLGLRAIVTVANNWAAYGGIPQYLRWARLGTATFGALDRFFHSARIRRWYRQHVLRLVNRRSTVTGIRYGDDPTIMAWELFNESTATRAGFAARRRFIRRMAALIRTHAPEQLVSSGVTGYATLARRDEWLKVCRLTEVDFCDAHLYPEETWRLRQPRDLDLLIDDRVQLAQHIAGKPLLFGEFGFTPGIHRRRDLGRRSQRYWVDRFLHRVHYDGAAGALIWFYMPHCNQPRRFPVWVDHKKSLPLRRVLRRWAARFRQGPPRRTNPKLGASHGAAPLYAPLYTVTRRPPRRRWRPCPRGPAASRARWAVHLEITDFRQGRFYDQGHHTGGVLKHVYGAGHGFWEYRVPRLRRPASRLTLELRLSSEYPGATAPVDGVSAVVVKLAGRVVARLQAAPDDGQGRAEQITIRDRRVLRALRRRALPLRLEVPPGKLARGLCVYGLPGTASGQGQGQGQAGPKGRVGPIRITATLASGRQLR